MNDPIVVPYPAPDFEDQFEAALKSGQSFVIEVRDEPIKRIVTEKVEELIGMRPEAKNRIKSLWQLAKINDFIVSVGDALYNKNHKISLAKDEGAVFVHLVPPDQGLLDS